MKKVMEKEEMRKKRRKEEEGEEEIDRRRERSEVGVRGSGKANLEPGLA